MKLRKSLFYLVLTILLTNYCHQFLSETPHSQIFILPLYYYNSALQFYLAIFTDELRYAKNLVNRNKIRYTSKTGVETWIISIKHVLSFRNRLIILFDTVSRVLRLQMLLVK